MKLGSGHPQENRWTQVIRFEELRQFDEGRQGWTWGSWRINEFGEVRWLEEVRQRWTWEVEPMYELRGSWTIWESVQFEKAKRWMNLKE
jgi:hypothetical protein